jgi:hypothetical protein
MKRFAKLAAVCAGAPLLALGVAIPTAWADGATTTGPGTLHNVQGQQSHNAIGSQGAFGNAVSGFATGNPPGTVGENITGRAGGCKIIADPAL